MKNDFIFLHNLVPMLNYYQRRIDTIEAEIAPIADAEKNGTSQQAKRLRFLKKQLIEMYAHKLLELEGWKPCVVSTSIEAACAIFDDSELLRRYMSSSDSQKVDLIASVAHPPSRLLSELSTAREDYSTDAIRYCQSFISDPSERQRCLKIKSKWYELNAPTRNLHPEIIRAHPELFDSYPELRQLYPELSDEFPEYLQ